MGGAYLTLLNTIANMGVILPKTPVFALIDHLTSSTCRDAAGGRLPLPAARDWAASQISPDHDHDFEGLKIALDHAAAPHALLACPKKLRDLESGPAAAACAAAGGRCVMDRDGFYVVSYTMVVAGVALGFMFIRLFPRLTRLPLERWRAAPGGGKR